MTLNNHHIQDLLNSGLTDESISGAGFYSVSPDEVRELLGFNLNDSGGMAIPYYTPNENIIRYTRVKLDNPPLIDGRLAKYLSPKGSGNRIYFPKIVTNHLNNPATILYITEGEKKAIKASQEGLVCIAIPGVWCWKGKDSSGESSPISDFDLITLQNRVVYIVFDSDADQKPSVKKAEIELAKELSTKGAIVKAIRIPGKGNEKVGFDDYLVSHSVKGFLQLPQHDPLNDDKTKKCLSQSSRLVDLASKLDLFHDENHEAFIFIDNEAIPLKSRKVKQWLSNQLYTTENVVPNSDALNQALITLEAKAVFNGPNYALHNRTAKANNAFWYDLGNGKTIQIDPDGWKITDAPILFRRYSHQQNQVNPAQDGDPFKVLEFINVKEESRLLVLVCIISYFIPDIPHPIIHPHGPHGSGKTSLFRIIKKLCDPSSIEALMTPRDINQLIQIIAHHHVCLFDNLSDISGQMSDVLSQACTGGGFSKRQLFTDDDDIIYQVKRCIGINGINLLINRADLMDRSVLIGLDRIEPTERIEEAIIWEKFNEALPGILGGVFDTISNAMMIYPSVMLPTLPRMADFTKWGYAIAQALGNRGAEFLESYQKNINRHNDEVIQSNTLAQAVLIFMKDKNSWDGTIKAAWTGLHDIADPQKNDSTFPKSDRSLRKHLERIKSNLMDYGIRYDIGKRGENGYPIYFQKDPDVGSFGSANTALPDLQINSAEQNLKQISQSELALDGITVIKTSQVGNPEYSESNELGCSGSWRNI